MRSIGWRGDAGFFLTGGGDLVRRIGMALVLLASGLTAALPAPASASASQDEAAAVATISDRAVREIQQIRRLRYSSDLERAIRRADAALERDWPPLDRAALFVERASLNERLARFRDAAGDLEAAIALNALPPALQERQYIEVAEFLAADQDFVGAVSAYEAGFNAGARVTPDDVLLTSLVYVRAADGAESESDQAALLARGLPFVEFAYENESPRTHAAFQLMAAYASRLRRYETARAVTADWLEAFPESEAAQSSVDAIGALPASCRSGDDGTGAGSTSCDVALATPALADLHPAFQLPVRRVPPVYPSRAAEQGIEGACTVRLDITPDGEPRNIRPTECDGVFERATINAIQAWRYTPAVENGEPVWRRDVQTTLEFELD